MSNDNISSCFLILNAVDHISNGVSWATHEPTGNILGMLLRLAVKSPTGEGTAGFSNGLVVVGCNVEEMYSNIYQHQHS